MQDLAGQDGVRVVPDDRAVAVVPGRPRFGDLGVAGVGTEMATRDVPQAIPAVDDDAVEQAVCLREAQRATGAGHVRVGLSARGARPARGAGRARGACDQAGTGLGALKRS